ncbi:MAG TPA: YraN family protein [Acidimicrobiales bacterium]|nr:YraN family protein [Acidimicrobiales bacterium]
MAGDRRRRLGASGEDAAVRWYLQGGHEVLARNWRCAEGEIDLIARAPDGTIVICEVKTRTSDAFGSPFEAVTAAKQRRIRRLAARWLAQGHPALRGGRGPSPVDVRFDVAAVRVGERGALSVEVLESAF